MLALIVDDNHSRQAELATAFIHAGFQTASTSSKNFAECFIQNGLVDLLVMTEQVEDQLTHSLSLMAEHQNALVETILLTPRCERAMDELFSLLPSMHCMIAPDTAPALVIKLAISALRGADSQSARQLLLPKPEGFVLSDDTPAPYKTLQERPEPKELLRAS